MRNIDEYTNEYVNLPFEAYQVNYRRKKVIEILEKYPHERIVEVGCGMCPLFFDFTDFKEMTIIEPSQTFFDNAKKSEHCTEAVKLKRGFVEDMVSSLEDEKYDYVVVSSLLHEVEDPLRLLKKIKKLCTKDTVVHINVPNAFSLHRLLALEMGLIQDVWEKSKQQIQMQQNSIFDLTSLSDMVKEVGFEIIEKGSYFPKFFTHKQMQKMLENDIIGEEHLDGMYHMEKYLPEFGSEIYVNVRIRS